MRSRARRARRPALLRRAAAAAGAVVLAAALALLPATAASAHDYLISSDPSADSTLSTAQAEVTLTFNEAVLDFADSTRLQVTGPDGATDHAETACPTVADTIVSAPVTLTRPGKYTVVWRIVSADGHAVSDTFSFTYAPADGSGGSSAAAAPSAGPACGEGGVDAAPTTGTGSDSYLLIGTAVVIAIVAVVTFGIIILRRPREGDDD